MNNKETNTPQEKNTDQPISTRRSKEEIKQRITQIQEQLWGVSFLKYEKR